MHKMFQYRIFPTKKQVHKLNETLNECRWLYNHFLEKRKTTYEQEGQSLSCYHQIDTLGLLKQERPPLKQVHSQVLQNVAVRVDLAFKAFFRRRIAGEKPGYPRFRGRDRYDSPIKGKVKTCTIRRSSTGKWYVSFSVECEPEPLPETPTQVGIDVGLKTFATLSNEEEIGNPRFFRKEEKALARVQRKHSKLTKGTPE